VCTTFWATRKPNGLFIQYNKRLHELIKFEIECTLTASLWQSWMLLVSCWPEVRSVLKQPHDQSGLRYVSIILGEYKLKIGKVNRDYEGRFDDAEGKWLRCILWQRQLNSIETVGKGGRATSAIRELVAFGQVVKRTSKGVYFCLQILRIWKRWDERVREWWEGQVICMMGQVDGIRTSQSVYLRRHTCK